MSDDGVAANTDLLAYYKLDKVYNLALTLQPSNYLYGVPGAGELRRGPGMELAPLADMFAPRSEDVGPIPDTLLQCLSLLQPGSYQPPEEVLGAPLVTNLRSQPGPDKKKHKKRKSDKNSKEERKKRRRGSVEPD